MGEGTQGVDDAPAEVEDIAREIEDLRGEMTPLLAELDRRRREVLDWRHQARKHAFLAGAAAAVLVLAAAVIAKRAVERIAAARV